MNAEEIRKLANWAMNRKIRLWSDDVKDALIRSMDGMGQGETIDVPCEVVEPKQLPPKAGE